MPTKDVVRSVRRVYRWLDRRDRRVLALLTLAQASTALLDLIGVVLVGALGFITASAWQDAPVTGPVGQLINVLGLTETSLWRTILVLTGLASILFVAKGVAMFLLLRATYRFLARCQVQLAVRMTSGLLEEHQVQVRSKSSQELAYAIVHASYFGTVLFLGTVIVMIGEIAMLVILVAGLAILDPVTTAAALAYFGIIAVSLSAALGRRSAILGEEIAASIVRSTARIQEGVGAYREVLVLDRRSLLLSQIQSDVASSSTARSMTAFLGQVPRLIYEGALMVGAFGLAAWLFTTQPPAEAVALLAVFLAAGSRIMPSLLRLNSQVLAMQSAAAQANVAMRTAEDYDLMRATREWLPDSEDCGSEGLLGTKALEISVNGLTAGYFGQPYPTLLDVSFEVAGGESVALVGRSGAGKSSLMDALVGVLPSQEGDVRIGGARPRDAIRASHGAISYVPQSVMILNTNVRENVALALPREEVCDERVWQVLEQVGLAELVRGLSQGLDTEVGERGTFLSGGQRQRLGLARALYSRPRLLLLDEATSAIDIESEAFIAETLDGLRGDTTVVSIAHRISSMQRADRILYLESGRLVTQGTFEQLLQRAPGFVAMVRESASSLGVPKDARTSL